MLIKRKNLVVVTLFLFWLTIIFLPQCGGTIQNYCEMMDGYNFIWREIDSIYLPMLLIEWVALSVNFLTLFYFFSEK